MLRQERKTNLKKKIGSYVDNINIHSHIHITHFSNKSRNKYLPVLVVEEIIWRRERACAVFVFKMFCVFYGGCRQREAYRCDFSRQMQEDRNALSVT